MAKTKVKLVCYHCNQSNTVEVDLDKAVEVVTLNIRRRSVDVVCPNPACGTVNAVDV